MKRAMIFFVHSCSLRQRHDFQDSIGKSVWKAAIVEDFEHLLIVRPTKAPR